MTGAIANEHRQGHGVDVTADRQRSIDMVLHSPIHLEIARQRHHDLLAEAERQRTTKALNHAGVIPARRRPQLWASALRSAFNLGNAPHSDVDVGFEV
jgi:hypothetical protein